jgi:hypothetical protein
VDGVVPARPVDLEGAKIPADVLPVNDLLLMPASRAEIYVRNDLEPLHSDTQVLILRTKGVGFESRPRHFSFGPAIPDEKEIERSQISLQLRAHITQHFQEAIAFWR